MLFDRIGYVVGNSGAGSLINSCSKGCNSMNIEKFLDPQAGETIFISCRLDIAAAGLKPLIRSKALINSLC